MARTIIGLNDPRAVKRYSGNLAVDIARESYFQRNMMGVGEQAQTPIQLLTDLEKAPGEQITYDLSYQLRGTGVEGDQIIEGQEEPLDWASDVIYIDQKRHGVNAGGRMTRKRTLHDLRLVAKERLKEWWARWIDEQLFIYLSGMRGTNVDFLEPTSSTGRANNPLYAPDAQHQLFAGVATSKATLTDATVMNLTLIDKAITRAKKMGGGTQRMPRIQPLRIEGGSHFVVLMGPYSEYNLRANSSTGQWLDIQKAAAAAEGSKNRLFTGSMGMYNKAILHCHEAVIAAADGGAGANIQWERNLFLGRQAAVMAFGAAGGAMRYEWYEELEDRGNQIVIGAGSILGIKKTRYAPPGGTAADFGVIALDCGAKEP